MGLKTALWLTGLVFVCMLGACHAPMHHASHTDAASKDDGNTPSTCSDATAVQTALTALSASGIAVASSSPIGVIATAHSRGSALHVAVLANATTLYGIFIQPSDCSAIQIERTDLTDLHDAKVQQLHCQPKDLTAAKIGEAQSATAMPYDEIDTIQNADDGVGLEVILLDHNTCQAVDSYSAILKANSP